MAQVWNRTGAASAGLVLLLQLALSVLTVGDDAGACPSYPVDPTWKNSMSAQEKSFIETGKRHQLYMEGTFKHGAKALLQKQDSAPNATEGVKMVVKKARPSNSRGIYDVSVILTLEFRPPGTSQGFPFFDDSGNLRRPRDVSEGVEIVGDGRYDEATGDLCVLGCILSVCKYKLRLKYPVPKTIVDVSVSGNLTSTGGATDETFFDTISIHAFSNSPFTFTMNTTLASVCPTMARDVRDGKLWNVDINAGDDDDDYSGLLDRLSQGPMVVTWNPECEGANCSPFSELEYAGGGNRSFIRAQRSASDGGEMQASILFSNHYPFFDSRIVDPTTTDGALLAEGTWNSKTGQMCMIACRLYGKQDCEIAITAQLPLTFTVTQRSSVVGHIQSLRNESDPAYFKRISFRAISQESSIWVPAISEFGEETSYAKSSKNQPEYVYTKVETAKAECAHSSTEKKKAKSTNSGSYISGEDWDDMDFFVFKDLSSHKSSSVQPVFRVPVRMTIFTRGNEFMARTFDQVQRKGANVTGIGVTAPADVDAVQDGIMNVSYSLNYPTEQDGREFMQRSQELGDNMVGEGIYDSNTGKLCLVGCRAVVDLKRDDLQLLEGDPPKDCQAFFTIQLPPIGSTKALKGTVKSLRDPTDPLYFLPESFSGIVFRQAADTLWRIDIEIVLSVLMLSLTVVCLLRQVLYSKRHPDSLPYISLSMLLLLCLAHMIPLILDFEALFQKQQSGRNNTFRIMDSVGGWPEVNKVVVRFTTMAAMLLQLRLLQLVWKSRTEARLTGNLAPAVQERRLLYYVVPLYVAGGLIAVLFHAMLHFKPSERLSGHGGGVWRDLHEYGGLLLDLHLLPQAIANVLWDATGQAPLSMPFYMGMAVVRSVPHVYDLCRRLRFVPTSLEMYEYANPEWDFYSGTSDVVIPCGIVLLATVVWVQQRWGGRCVLPRRWRRHLEMVEYERVEESIADFAL